MAATITTTGRNVLQCNKCGKIFSKKYNLDRHAVIHTGNFRWYCELCKKGFSQKDMYTVHMRGHEGLKYRCEYCSKGFSTQMQLKYHLSEHTGIYRFKCNTCGKGFNLFPQYEKHVKTHNLFNSLLVTV